MQVCVVGALVLVYCARYFEPGEEGTGRFAAHLTAFAGSMPNDEWTYGGLAALALLAGGLTLRLRETNQLGDQTPTGD